MPWLLALVVASTSLNAQVIESGRFRLYKFLQPVGEESYETIREGDTNVTRVKFEFTDRGSKVPLSATLVTRADGQPVRFEVKGSTSRFSRVDSTVEIKGDQGVVREGKIERTVALPEHWFTSAGYAPGSAQMLMIRRWIQEGKPAVMTTLPSGEVRIEERGRDEIAGKQLTRYAINGIIWGQEAVWTDTSGKLVALIGIDAEFDHFEAILEGYEASLGAFVERAAAGNMDHLSELAAGARLKTGDRIAIIHARVIDGTGAAPISDATILIKKGRIAAIGQGTKLKVPRGTTIIDASGKTVLPGLWDMHAHFEQAEWGPVYLAAGVTTVRDNANEFEFLVAMRDALRSGKGLGPRLLLAGIVDGDSKNALGVIRANTPEEAKAVVDRYHRAGFEQVKIYSSIKPDILKAIAAEAHRQGMTVTGHVPSGMTFFEAVESGMDMVSHVFPQMYLAAFPKDIKRAPGTMPAFKDNGAEFAALLQFLKQHHTVLDPTLTVFELAYHDSAQPNFDPGVAKVAPELAGALKESGVPKMVAAMVKPGFDGAIAFVGAVHKAGVPVVVGTDQTVPGFSVYREMELYVQGGFTPLEAIQAATIVPARVMRIDKETGTIEKGKSADLIILRGDPLRKIDEIRTVETTVRGGVVYDCAKLWRMVGFQP